MIHVKVQNVGPIRSAGFDISGVTILTGESGSGKSSLVSVIQSAILNKFPNRLLRIGESYLSVQLSMDGEDIIWTKKTNTSAQIIFRDEILSKTSQYTITALEEFLNMLPIEVGNEKVSVHFIDQFEPPLVKNYSHKKLSDVLSASSEIDRAHKLIKKVRDESLKATGSFNTLTGLIVNSKLSIDRLSSIVQIAEVSKSDVLKIITQKTELEQRLSTLSSLVQALDLYNSLHVQIQDGQDLINGLKKAIGLNERLNSLQVLRRYLLRISWIEAKISAINELIASYRDYRNIQIRLSGLRAITENLEKGIRISGRMKDIEKFTRDKICPICGVQIELK